MAFAAPSRFLRSTKGAPRSVLRGRPAPQSPPEPRTSSKREGHRRSASLPNEAFPTPQPATRGKVGGKVGNTVEVCVQLKSLCERARPGVGPRTVCARGPGRVWAPEQSVRVWAPEQSVREGRPVGAPEQFVLQLTFTWFEIPPARRTHLAAEPTSAGPGPVTAASPAANQPRPTLQSRFWAGTHHSEPPAQAGPSAVPALASALDGRRWVSRPAAQAGQGRAPAGVARTAPGAPPRHARASFGP